MASRPEAGALRKFDFLPAWATLSRGQQLAKLRECACHELHFFVQQRDPELFGAVVLPLLQVWPFRACSAGRLANACAFTLANPHAPLLDKI